MSTSRDVACASRRWWSIAVLALAPVAAPVARAQEAAATRLVPGSRVRVTVELSPEAPFGVNEPRYVGTLLRLRGDTLVAHIGDDTVALQRARIRTLELSIGRRSRGQAAGRGAFKGALVGALAGGFLGFLAYGSCEGFCPVRPAEGVALGATVLGGAGAVLGAFVGAGSRSDRWREVPLTPGMEIGWMPAPHPPCGALRS